MAPRNRPSFRAGAQAATMASAANSALGNGLSILTSPCFCPRTQAAAIATTANAASGRGLGILMNPRVTILPVSMATATITPAITCTPLAQSHPLRMGRIEGKITTSVHDKFC